MKTLFTLSIFLLAISIKAQDFVEISVGQGYSNQTHYSLSTQTDRSISNEAWDIAFSALGQQDAGVFINESATFMSPQLQLYVLRGVSWEDDITNAATYEDSTALYNPEMNWAEGAFNTTKDPSSHFDFGWGAYNPQTHKIEGNTVYLVKQRNATYLKLMIDELAGGIYTFRYANLDGSNEKVATVDKSDSAGSLIHYSFGTSEVVDIPTDSDIVFQRYTTPLDAGGNIVEYTVTGVLLQPGVEAVAIRGVDPTAINAEDYDDQYSSQPNTIGYDWKSFDFTEGWSVETDRTYLVKNRDGAIYQLTFVDFEGSSTGTSTVEIIEVSKPSSTSTLPIPAELTTYPNPTTDFVTIGFPKDLSFDYTIYDQRGQVMTIGSSRTNSKIDMQMLSSGTYFISIEGAQIRSTKQVFVR